MATSTPAPIGIGQVPGAPYSSTGQMVPAATPLTGATGLNQLDIANGMTAGWGWQDGHTSNPGLIGEANGVALNPYGGGPSRWQPSRIGMLRSVPGTMKDWQGNNVVYTMYFLYNPNQIQAAFVANPNVVPPFYTYDNAQAPKVPNFTTGQTVSWTLLFDRTYDLMYGPDPGGNRGVLKDTGALYLLLGAFESEGGVPYSAPVQAIFGQTNNGEIWGFTGYVTSASITYGIFKYNMIPSRAEVQIQMLTTYVSLGPPPSSSSNQSGGINSAIVGAPGPSSGYGPPNPLANSEQAPHQSWMG